MKLIILGDIHAQANKFWRMLSELGYATADRAPTAAIQAEDAPTLVLLGDLVHAKSRNRYGELIGVNDYDEHNPEHLQLAEAQQESFLRAVMDFQQALPAGRMIVLLGNHDHNAIDDEQGPLRTDDVHHLEWKAAYSRPFPDDLKGWIASWPREHSVQGLHLAHVGPHPQHNTYDQGFYLENRRAWIREDRDVLAETHHRLGVYGHTPVRGGVNVASRGRAILLDTNGYGDEYVILEVSIHEHDYHVQMRGLFFDERITRERPPS